MKIFVTFIVILCLVAAGIGGWVLYTRADNGSATVFRTATVKRGEIRAAIGATGTVEPEEVVDVGAQVAGQINEFGKDTRGKQVDYGSPVDETTVLAQIDQTLFQADVATANAQLASAKAGQQHAEADLLQLKAKLDQAQRDWDRAQKLGPSDALAATTFDAFRSTFEQARANVTVGEATIAQTKAAVSQAEAQLKRVQRNLDYTTIRSPVKGVIIDRRVNIGQTVVSSLNAPSLFLIAKDLKRMQVWVAVNEADIGQIKPGQSVSFTVDAFPGKAFKGEVGKVRLNATMTQNVVTYTVEVLTDNSDGTLLPYLTANVQFETAKRDNVLMAPNAALRWVPDAAQIAPDIREATLAEMATPRKGRGDGAAPKSGTEKDKPADANAIASAAPGDSPAREHRGPPARLWVADGNFVRPIPVRTGLTDGAQTEIRSGDVTEGMTIVVSDVRPEQQAGGSGGATNPFAPPAIGRGKR